MLSLAKIGRGREDYHLRAVGADASAYYSERGEVAGRWLGGGATVLGLNGRVEDEALLAVLAGRDPAAAKQLVSPPRTGQRNHFENSQKVTGYLRPRRNRMQNHRAPE